MGSEGRKVVVVVKESRASEQRVALVPHHLGSLPKEVLVRIESGAGDGVGLSDEDYRAAGAQVWVPPEGCSPASTQYFQSLFQDAWLIARVKRAEAKREANEVTAFGQKVTLVGFLDSLDPKSPSNTYKEKECRSIDLSILKLPPDHPGNAIVSMSRLAGKLAMDEALQLQATVASSFAGRRNSPIVVLGAFGVAGKSAVQRLFESIEKQPKGGQIDLARQLHLLVREQTEEHRDARFKEVFGLSVMDVSGCQMFQTDRYIELLTSEAISKPGIWISSARIPGKQGEKFITEQILKCFNPGTIMLDLAMVEGGNVAYSKGDRTVFFNARTGLVEQTLESDGFFKSENWVEKMEECLLIRSVTGYPKRVPKEASEAVSSATRYWISDCVASAESTAVGAEE